MRGPAVRGTRPLMSEDKYTDGTSTLLAVVAIPAIHVVLWGLTIYLGQQVW